MSAIPSASIVGRSMTLVVLADGTTDDSMECRDRVCRLSSMFRSVVFSIPEHVNPSGIESRAQGDIVYARRRPSAHLGMHLTEIAHSVPAEFIFLLEGQDSLQAPGVREAIRLVDSQPSQPVSAYGPYHFVDDPSARYSGNISQQLCFPNGVSPEDYVFMALDWRPVATLSGTIVSTALVRRHWRILAAFHAKSYLRDFLLTCPGTRRVCQGTTPSVNIRPIVPLYAQRASRELEVDDELLFHFIHGLCCTDNRTSLRATAKLLSIVKAHPMHCPRRLVFLAIASISWHGTKRHYLRLLFTTLKLALAWLGRWFSARRHALRGRHIC